MRKISLNNLNEFYMKFSSKVFQLLWQLPQILLVRLVSLLFKKDYLWTVDGVKIYRINYTDGLSLGDTIFVNLSTIEGRRLIKHEFGHIIQSRILGWLYLPVIFIPSFLWFLFVALIQEWYRLDDAIAIKLYYKFYTEKWANVLMKISTRDFLK